MASDVQKQLALRHLCAFANAVLPTSNAFLQFESFNQTQTYFKVHIKLTSTVREKPVPKGGNSSSNFFVSLWGLPTLSPCISVICVNVFFPQRDSTASG